MTRATSSDRHSDSQASSLSAERKRLDEDRLHNRNWRSWGPYVSERAWGTVREDYSSNGDAWGFLTHDQARSKAYRWGEDGLAGICDRYQLLVFALAFWNGQDEILKERLFGVVPQQNNHGEDVREYYYYLDASPTHSYLKYLYKYPQAKFPYQQLIDESQRRGIEQPEFELLDTGVFDDDRYFDIFVEYAKADPEDICVRIEIFNRGSEPARLHVLPQLWFRNTWSWGDVPGPTPSIACSQDPNGQACLVADDSTAKPISNLLTDYALGKRYLYAESGGKPLFTNNESNRMRLYGCPDHTAYVKDAFHRDVINGESCVNPDQVGTKACVHYENVTVPANASVVLRLRLTDRPTPDAIRGVDAVVDQRKSETDTFYDELHPPKASEDERRVQRQALAGMIWSKQFYYFDVHKWLDGDDSRAKPPASRHHIRNEHWKHLNSMRILSMPDKWEYPWFAAWDLAFQCIPLALVDPEFAKEQLWLLLFEQFQHPNGQIPAYEWEFSDLNPPVHAWAIWRVYNMDRIQNGRADREFLEKCFHKLLLNFTWWVNKVDAEGHNVFEGGFLGLDNITTFDRSTPPSDGSSLKQADATGWMGMYCLNLMRIALELAKENKTYVGLAIKFFEHYVYIGSAMKNMGGRDYELWSEEDGFFFDALCYPDGSYHRFRLHSLVSLIPLYAVERLEEVWTSEFPEFKANLDWFMRNRGHLTEACLTTSENANGKVHLLSLVDADQLRRIVEVLWDESEFLSPYGLRSLSKYHEQHPFTFGDQTVKYDPAESTTWLKGGNSNWRGPIWFPTSFLMIESLRKLAKVYGESIRVPAEPDAERETMTLSEVAEGHANRLISLFTRDSEGRRAIYGRREKMQHDPHWRDCLLFHEYFNAETGEGLGANHQTGWTGLVASLIDEWRR
ncbi:MGH1-like glycoside hydrolase domain-containing protein [Novipirellula caenicola]|uniref:Mannosylglycerate hydrolase MGH1-like glycoside hydrolase domain-containing protein n=1 Tax=Novipirellula caenicola TaxID=1536901 RepID=A0ABP9VKD3_9BACT